MHLPYPFTADATVHKRCLRRKWGSDERSAMVLLRGWFCSRLNIVFTVFFFSDLLLISVSSLHSIFLLNLCNFCRCLAFGWYSLFLRAIAFHRYSIDCLDFFLLTHFRRKFTSLQLLLLLLLLCYCYCWIVCLLMNRLVSPCGADRSGHWARPSLRSERRWPNSSSAYWWL